MAYTIYIIGHSTHSIDEFIRILSAYEVGILVVVRRFSRSRCNPQSNDDELREYLSKRQIDYIHLEGLGRRRKTTEFSINTAWKNPSFRGYADTMQTPEFAENLDRLVKIASEKKTAIIGAEAVPRRCHRSLIGDMLLVRGF